MDSKLVELQKSKEENEAIKAAANEQIRQLQADAAAGSGS